MLRTACTEVTPTDPTPHREEEMLVPDARSRLTPAQMVERKLLAMLETNPVLVSHLQDGVRRRPG